MLASLIIPYYKDIPALELILTALNNQSAKGDFEVIIAEDNNAPETILFIEKIRPLLLYPLQHIAQEDIGYRRAKALNNGIRIAKGELIIFTDGDCIPHKHFIRSYLKEIEEKKILYGRRVNLGQKISLQLLHTRSAEKLNLLTIALAGSTRVAEGLYLPFYPEVWKSKRQLWGCNMGVLKKHLVEVNGFDEDYAEYGPEDLDICTRLQRSGCALKSVKFQAIIYHLYHKTRALDDVMQRGKQLFDEKMKAQGWFCKNGLVKTGTLA
jgi:cellulose synthase/poly-beta-1,6-N-acetylglucosamine synthase-like glycosyltransferase